MVEASLGRVVWRRLSPLLVAVLVAASCTPDRSSPEPPAEGSTELRVMTFNILYGGSYGFDRVVRTIREADADVVAIQEPYGRMHRLAAELGWFASPRLHLLSRFPVLEATGGGGVWGYVAVRPGAVVVAASVHFPSVRYGPYQVRRGASLEEVLEAEEDRRMPEARKVLETVMPIARQDVPVFVMGDLNSPSHRDWTRAVARERKEVEFPVEWPVPATLEAAGLRDAFREIHPDPVGKPGFTWTPGSGDPPRVRRGEVHDRIDFIWVGGPVEVLDAQVVGERGPHTDIVVEPWSSDHRAVVSTVRVEPKAPPPSLGMAETRVERGRSFEVTVFALRRADHRLSVTSVGSRDPVVQVPADVPPGGSVEVPSTELPPGTYVVALEDGSGRTIAGVAFWVAEPGTEPEVTVSAPAYRRGEPIDVSWSAGPGNRYDWLAVTPADRGPGWYMGYRYVDGAVEGTAAIDEQVFGRWPLPPGRYRIRLCVDDSYRCPAASAAFTVKG